MSICGLDRRVVRCAPSSLCLRGFPVRSDHHGRKESSVSDLKTWINQKLFNDHQILSSARQVYYQQHHVHATESQPACYYPQSFEEKEARGGHKVSGWLRRDQSSSTVAKASISCDLSTNSFNLSTLPTRGMRQPLLPTVSSSHPRFGP